MGTAGEMFLKFICGLLERPSQTPAGSVSGGCQHRAQLYQAQISCFLVLPFS